MSDIEHIERAANTMHVSARARMRERHTHRETHTQRESVRGREIIEIRGEMKHGDKWR